MVTVKIPATSANVGSGFDCIGIAFQIYNIISAEEIDIGLEIEIRDKNTGFIPTNEKNMVYNSMMTAFEKIGYKPKGLHIIQENSIPVTRGLGSSATCVVGGIMAANAICGNPLSKTDVINLAASIEGHPDNVTPAVTGGLAIAVKNSGIKYSYFPIDNNDLSFAFYIPSFSVRTKMARSVLPETVNYRDASYNIGRSAMLTTAFLTKNYDMLSTALQDRMHQYYRKKLIGGSAKIFYEAERFGALGTYISG
ncbi:MAG: homoserine kinase, partial [Clostridia bacterium]|nr:homoserine kinase [Clostridia bacterium]